MKAWQIWAAIFGVVVTGVVYFTNTASEGGYCSDLEIVRQQYVNVYRDAEGDLYLLQRANVSRENFVAQEQVALMRANNGMVVQYNNDLADAGCDDKKYEDFTEEVERFWGMYWE